LLAVLVQHIGFQLILAPSASSSSSSSSNSNASSQPISGAAATATAARGGAPTPTARPGSGTPTPAISPTPGASPTPGPPPTATPAPATLNVDPTTISIFNCLLGAQSQFTVANTGGVSFSWIATADGTGYKLTPDSGSLDGGKQQIVTVSRIGATGKITVTAQSARNSPQQVSVNCTL
jgi:hypothetical protein